MTRVTVTLVVLLLLMNSAATMMVASGLSEDLGVDINPGLEKKMDKLVERMKAGFEPNTGIIESTISLTLSFGALFEIVVESVFAAPTALTNMGLPSDIVYGFFAPAYVLSVLEMALVATGGGDL